MRHEQTLRDDSYSTKESFTKKKGLNIYMGGMGLENISYIKITSSYWSSGPILPGELVSKVA